MSKEINPSDITPIGEHIVIKMERIEEKTDGGIIMPDAHVQQQNASATRAEIVAKGHEAFAHYIKGTPMPSEGDYVITARYCGLEVDTTDGVYTICKDEDVIAVIKRSD